MPQVWAGRSSNRPHDEAERQPQTSALGVFRGCCKQQTTWSVLGDTCLLIYTSKYIYIWSYPAGGTTYRELHKAKHLILSQNVSRTLASILYTLFNNEAGSAHKISLLTMPPYSVGPIISNTADDTRNSAWNCQILKKYLTLHEGLLQTRQ